MILKIKSERYLNPDNLSNPENRGSKSKSQDLRGGAAQVIASLKTYARGRVGGAAAAPPGGRRAPLRESLP